MAISLNSLIQDVRTTLSDVPDEFLSNDQIYVELDKANVFCDEILISTTTDAFREKCVFALATYYAYINYTTLAERQLGTLPPTSKIRLDALRNVALSFLQLKSEYPLSDNLTLDMDSFKQTNSGAIVLCSTVLEED